LAEDENEDNQGDDYNPERDKRFMEARVDLAYN
jgi:hypothetical protein